MAAEAPDEVKRIQKYIQGLKDGWTEDMGDQTFRLAITPWIDRCETLLRAIDTLRAENDRLTKLMAGDPGVIDMYADKADVAMECRHWAVRLVAASLMKSFKECGGENVVEFGILPREPGFGPLVLTMQRRLGMTPCQIIGELKAGLASAIAIAEAAERTHVDDEKLARLRELSRPMPEGPIHEPLPPSQAISDLIDRDFISEVEEEVGMGHGAWDTVSPRDIVLAVLAVARRRS